MVIGYSKNIHTPHPKSSLTFLIGISSFTGSSTFVGSTFINVGSGVTALGGVAFFLLKSGIFDKTSSITGLNLSYLFVCDANLLFAALIFGKMWFIISETDKTVFI